MTLASVPALLQAPSVSIFGPVDAVLGSEVLGVPVVEWILLALVLVNLVGRALEHRRHVRQADDGDDAITRHPLRVATNLLLVVGAFYLATIEYHSGIVLSVLVVGMVVADLFEVEARKVEVRREIEIERPKGAIAASLFVLAYTLYISLFFVVKPVWEAVV